MSCISQLAILSSSRERVVLGKKGGLSGGNKVQALSARSNANDLTTGEGLEEAVGIETKFSYIVLHNFSLKPCPGS